MLSETEVRAGMRVVVHDELQEIDTLLLPEQFVVTRRAGATGTVVEPARHGDKHEGRLVWLVQHDETEDSPRGEEMAYYSFKEFEEA